MKFTPSQLEGVLVIEPDVFRDQRGFFLESYNHRKYVEGGVPDVFVQDNHSLSRRATIRGLHTQRIRPQAKLIRVLRGAIFDVVADIRRGSPNFLRWIGVELSSENFLQCYVPAGYAHGFCVLSEMAEVEYKCSQFYDPADELAILWNDPEIGVKWPAAEPILSPKDTQARPLRDVMDLLPEYKRTSA
jgi:dTDP-4-dehydrorhamnose 3,5-epimerase